MTMCYSLIVLKSILGGEGLSLQLRHISSFLIWYSSHHKSTSLLNEVILLIGAFVVLNSENQVMVIRSQFDV